MPHTHYVVRLTLQRTRQYLDSHNGFLNSLKIHSKCMTPRLYIVFQIPSGESKDLHVHLYASQSSWTLTNMPHTHYVGRLTWRRTCMYLDSRDGLLNAMIPARTRDTVRCNVLQCVGVCCRLLQCVTLCCSVLQCFTVDPRSHEGRSSLVLVGYADAQDTVV